MTETNTPPYVADDLAPVFAEAVPFPLAAPPVVGVDAVPFCTANAFPEPTRFCCITCRAEN